MRKEYDLNKGERGKFFGKVDTSNVTVYADDEELDEVLEQELLVLENNLNRIDRLRPRLSELDDATRNRFEKRLSKARAKLDEIALPE
jgi:tRNA(Phe) wybutosine-synthesizing methylase Tyw3